jgi:hypothetical protein
MSSRTSTPVVGQRIVRPRHWVQPGPFRGLLVESVDVGVQLPLVDPPNSSPTELYRRELPGPDEGIDLRGAHAEIGGDVFESEEARLYAGGPLASVAATSSPVVHNPNDSTDKGRLPVSLSVCLRLPSLTLVQGWEEHS